MSTHIGLYMSSMHKSSSRELVRTGHGGEGIYMYSGNRSTSSLFIASISPLLLRKEKRKEKSLLVFIGQSIQATCKPIERQ